MYIHDKHNWTNFSWDNSKIGPLLTSVRYLQGRLLGRMESLGFEFSERATLESLISDVVDTSRIEGEFLNSELVRSSIARKMGLDQSDFITIPRNIDGIVDVGEIMEFGMVIDGTLDVVDEVDGTLVVEG